MNYIDQLLEGIEEDDRAERSVLIKNTTGRTWGGGLEGAMWAANAEEGPQPQTQVQTQASQRDVVEIGGKLLVMKHGPRDWSLMMALLLKGEDRPWFASVSDNPQLAFRSFESRDEARYSRDLLALRIRCNAATVLYAGIRTERGKEVVSFRPADFAVEIAYPKSFQMYQKKEGNAGSIQSAPSSSKKESEQ
jgi:hypothetical protein